MKKLNNTFSTLWLKIKSLFIYTIIAFLIILPCKQYISYGIAPETILRNYQYITPNNYKDDHAKPDIFPQTNNLRRKSGSPFLAKGETLLLKGQVTDLGDAKIENARIKIWQANTFGYYNYLTDKEDLDAYDTDFLSAGQSITDNQGNYAFLTIMPGFYGHRTPHIHMSVEHDDFDPIELEVIFPKHPRNKTDPKIIKMNKIERKLITCELRNEDNDHPNQGKIATFNIKLNGLHRTKHD